MAFRITSLSYLKYILTVWSYYFYSLLKAWKVQVFYFIFLQYWGLNSRSSPWATPPVLFCEGFVQDRVSQTIFLDWLPTAILLISASWIARIYRLRYWLPIVFVIFYFNHTYSFYGNKFILKTLLKMFHIFCSHC
jgi:hypothetical protein